jgi:alpha-mannosidase
VDAASVVVTVLKKAEDSDDLILRAYETTGEATCTILRLPKWKRSIEATFGPCEIKTFRIPLDPKRPAMEADLLEEPLAPARSGL